jgi:hypothetical protein
MSDDAIDPILLQRMPWQGYQLSDKKANIVAEIADSRVRYAAAHAKPADICICHETVLPRLAHEDGFLVRTWNRPIANMQPTVWYLGNMEQAQ